MAPSSCRDSFGKGHSFAETMPLYEVDSVDATHPLTARHCWICPVFDIHTMELMQWTRHAAELLTSRLGKECMAVAGSLLAAPPSLAVSSGHVYTYMASAGTSVDHNRADRWWHTVNVIAVRTNE